MSATLQTVVALGIVALTVALLVRASLKKRREPGCGGGCGAVSPEIRKLQARLHRK